MSDIQTVYSKRSLLSESIKNTKDFKKETKSKPVPIPCNNCYQARIGINEVNEIDGIKKKINKEKSFEDITKILSNNSNFPPSDFSPNTPPEHSLIYSHLNNNDYITITNYNNYNLKEELIQSL